MAALSIELGDLGPALSAAGMQPQLAHVAGDGRIAMVDVGAKPATERFARAESCVRMSIAAAQALRAATLQKGDALAAAQIAGIFAAKQTAALIPLAHPLPLASVAVTFSWPEPTLLRIEATARTSAQTGVEMEAMVAASVAALTIYDMTKSLEKGIVIESVRLLEKYGGKSGPWHASEPS
jgi:cyclic pyranopterin phosphate synthase